MLYLIGLGLNERGISLEGREAIKKCKFVYLESYTVDFPYTIAKLEEIIGKKVIKLDREKVEDNSILKQTEKGNTALLVYGSPLFATTHISLLIEADKKNIPVKIIYSASAFDAIGQTGLQLYKFGKIGSMPKFQKNYTPDSFLEFVEENRRIKAHSLLLIDIGLALEDALSELAISLQRRKMSIEKLIICSNLGTDKSKIFYGTIHELKKCKITSPYCFIIPENMHFLEKEAVERFAI